MNVALCSFNDKIIRKLFVYFVAGAVLMWLPLRTPHTASPAASPHQCHRQFATVAGRGTVAVSVSGSMPLPVTLLLSPFGSHVTKCDT